MLLSLARAFPALPLPRRRVRFSLLRPQMALLSLSLSLSLKKLIMVKMKEGEMGNGKLRNGAARPRPCPRFLCS